MENSTSFRLGYVKDESGKLVRKLVKKGEEGKDPDVLYPVEAEFCNYVWTDDEHLDETKDALLEGMIESIRMLAKIDNFWHVKKEDDYLREILYNPLSEYMPEDQLASLIPQEAKEGKCSVAFRVSFPHMEGYYKWDEAEKIRKQMDGCLDTNG